MAEAYRAPHAGACAPRTSIPHNVLRDRSEWIVMAPDIDRDDDDPTERFALQTCPHCWGLTPVPLCFAMSACAICGDRIEVAPLIA
jgi:hypothetical protein